MRGALASALAIGAAAPLQSCTHKAAAEAPDALTQALRPRMPADKQDVGKRRYGFRTDEIVMKLVEGSQIRLSGGQLRFDRNRIKPKHLALLKRNRLDVTAAEAELANLNGAIALELGNKLQRLFEDAEADLDREHEALEASSGQELADLNLYYHLHVAPGHLDPMLARLNASPLVEIAYPPSVPVLPATDLPPTTPNYVSFQGYLNAPPYGVDARFAWSRAGGNGSGRKVVDIEYAWNLAHEDLGTPFTQLGTQSTGQSYIDHGTAALGEVVGAGNAYGITGIAYGAAFGVSSAVNITIGTAIRRATTAISSGDVIFLEVGVNGPPSGQSCDPGCAPCPPSTDSQFEVLPVEYDADSFDAIAAATAAGKIVVEAAGNGQMTLDNPVYGGKFQRTHDSGAIMVGAGQSVSTQPTCWSNAGTRVDVQGWGDSVFTLGYRSLVPGANANDQNQWYTNNFGGTSSATPMITGVVLDIQGRRANLGQPLMTATAMRSALVAAGIPQPLPVMRQVGPRVDLRCTLEPTQPPASAKIAAARQSSVVTVNMARRCDGTLSQRSIGSSGLWQAVSALPNSANIMPRDAAITLAAWGTTRTAAFFVGNDGAIKYFYEDNDFAWQGPVALSAANFAPPGARLAATMQAGVQLDVFVIDNNGVLQGFWAIGTGSFFGPLALTASNYAPAGGAIATGMQGTNQLDVFVVGNDGAIKANFVVGTGAWVGPVAISAANLFAPGTRIASGPQGTNQLDVFAVDWNGAIKAYGVAGTGAWFGPFNLSANGFATGTELVAIAWPTNQLNLFAMSSAGALSWLSVVGQGLWTQPVAISSADFGFPNAGIAAATEGSNKLDVFVVGHSGLSRASTTSGAGPWSAFVGM
jgi:hypothetical protein